MSDRPLIAIAGGGTGGHLFPALAVAEALQEANRQAEVVLLVTNRRFDRETLADGPVSWRSQPVRPFPRRPWQWPAFLVSWSRSVRQVHELFAARRPVAVLGTGGFGAGPALHVASRLDVAIGVLNPDAVPGRANRHLARKANAVFVQWPETATFFAGSDVQVTGCPVRPAFRTVTREQGVSEFELDKERKTLLITGASQGARTINRAVVELLDQLAARDDWQVLHLTGSLDHDEVKEAYARQCPSATVLPFTDRMPEAIAAADLVLSRSGAGTLAELSCVGRASILLPYPFGRDRHQEVNAKVMAKAGAARMLPDLVAPLKNAAQLGSVLQELMAGPERLDAMAAAARSLARPQAADDVAEWLLTAGGS
jgi:UDP-N-acetylglucosamine--N-acetylmuramyl-(pentapeptide) pyrophosphoryl-undecaprenol N-acetylglucosamine transferase